MANCTTCKKEVKEGFSFCFTCNQKKKEIPMVKKENSYISDIDMRINQSALACVVGLVKDHAIRLEEMPIMYSIFRKAIKTGEMDLNQERGEVL